jgi:hypothetical protein
MSKLPYSARIPLHIVLYYRSVQQKMKQRILAIVSLIIFSFSGFFQSNGKLHHQDHTPEQSPFFKYYIQAFNTVFQIRSIVRDILGKARIIKPTQQIIYGKSAIAEAKKSNIPLTKAQIKQRKYAEKVLQQMVIRNRSSI